MKKAKLNIKNLRRKSVPTFQRSNKNIKIKVNCLVNRLLCFFSCFISVGNLLERVGTVILLERFFVLEQRFCVPTGFLNTKIHIINCLIFPCWNVGTLEQKIRVNQEQKKNSMETKKKTKKKPKSDSQYRSELMQYFDNMKYGTMIKVKEISADPERFKSAAKSINMSHKSDVWFAEKFTLIKKFDLERYLANLSSGSRTKINTITDETQRFINAVKLLIDIGKTDVWFDNDYTTIKKPSIETIKFLNIN